VLHRVVDRALNVGRIEVDVARPDLLERLAGRLRQCAALRRRRGRGRDEQRCGRQRDRRASFTPR